MRRYLALLILIATLAACATPAPAGKAQPILTPAERCAAREGAWTYLQGVWHCLAK